MEVVENALANPPPPPSQEVSQQSPRASAGVDEASAILIDDDEPTTERLWARTKSKRRSTHQSIDAKTLTKTDSID